MSFKKPAGLDPADDEGLISIRKSNSEVVNQQNFCRDPSKGMAKLFACVTPKRGGSTKVVKSRSSANLTSSVTTTRPISKRLSASLNRFSLSSQKLREEDNHCRECGTRLTTSKKCIVCGDLDDLIDSPPSLDDVVVDGDDGRLSVRRQNRARRATLSKYMAVVQKNEGRKRINTMDVGFKSRLEAAKKGGTFTAEETNRRLQRANSLRKDFFSSSPRPDNDEFLLESIFEESPSTRSKRVSTQSEILDVPSELEEIYNKDVEVYLGESIKELAAQKEALKKSERQLHLNKIKQIKHMRNKLLTEQDEVIASVRSESKAVIKGLKKHMKELMATLKQKAKEGDDVDLDRQAAISEMDALSTAFAQSSNSNGEFEDVFQRERRDKKLANMLLQQRYENTLENLQEELAATVRHLNDLELEQFFPKCMQWKWRLNSGDDMFIGMRDVDLDMLDADIILGRGDELGTVHFEVSNIRAIVGIYQFSIDGNSVSAKLLRGLLTPTVNRLDLEISGNWNLDLRFKQGGDSKDLRPKWVKENSVFDLHLTKTTTGASLLRLPDRVIRWLTTSLLPSVISNSIMLNLPIRLGSFFQHPQNYIRVTGKIQMKGDIPPKVWCAPLVGMTPSAIAARKKMKISYEEAVMLDLMFRSDLATCAGFHRKAISMSRFYKWRLQYATHPTSSLAVMLKLIESDPHVLLQNHGGEVMVPPEGWALQLLNLVCELGVKPITFGLEIKEIDADINVKQAMEIFTGIYIESLEHDVEKAAGSRAVRAAEKKLANAKMKSEQVQRYLETYIAPILSDKISFDFDFAGEGGIVAGILMASIRNLDANLRLPKTFVYQDLFGQVNELSDGFNLMIEGHEGPEEGEYTLKGKHKWLNPKDQLMENIPDDDAHAIIKDVNLRLFPKGLPPGAINLTAESIRASLFICTLAEMTLPAPEVVQKHVRQSRHHRHSSALPPEATLHTTSSVEELLQRSRNIVSDLWTRYYTSKAVQGPNSSRDASADVEEENASNSFSHPVLPRWLTDEKHQLKVDLYGVKVQAIREIGVDKKDTVRVTLSKSLTSSWSSIARLQLRFSLAEVFENGEL